MRTPIISLGETLERVHIQLGQVAQLREELRQARYEIKRLRSVNNVKGLDLPRLRKQISFYLHPDKTGDNNVMRDVNILFDQILLND